MLFSSAISMTLPVDLLTRRKKMPLPAKCRRLASGSFVGFGIDRARARGVSAAKAAIEVARRREKLNDSKTLPQRLVKSHN